MSSVVAGDAWMREGISRIDVSLRDATGAAVLAVPAPCDAVEYHGIPVAPLAEYHARLTFPAEGTYTVQAVAVAADGRTLETAPRTVRAAPSVRSREFVFGSMLYIIPIVIIVLSCIFVPLVVRRTGSDAVRDRGALVISLVLWVDEIFFQIWWFLRGAWTVSNSLMLHMCGLAIMFIPVLYFTENEKSRQYLFEILYFFGLGGAVQALFAPDIGLHGFPEPKYFCFFISHCTIVLGVVYAAVLYRMELTWRSWIRIVVLTNAFTLAAYGVNLLLRLIPPYEVGNYFAMGYPPPNGSVIDIFANIFGPAPRYLIGLELMGIIVFALMYLPYPIRRALRRRREAQPGRA
ncbi:MAG: TIGR02206 family membrane protein [Spirochaetes bacterium]|nr:TIGR02206 family membrane protein [Spirochaetota bacterium]